MKQLFLIVPMSNKYVKMIKTNTEINLTIGIDFSSFSLSEKEVITGEICLSNGNYFFPEKRWNDFVVEILGWWLNDFHKMIQNKEQEQDFTFKDGDFCFLLSEESDMTWKISMYEEIPPQNAVIETIISKRKFLENLIITARKVLEFCNIKGWNTAEVKNLKLALDRLKA